MTLPDRPRSRRKTAEEANAPVGETLAIDEESVAAFLHAHRDFLVNRPELLSDMEIPVDSNGSVSLLERQVIALRDRNRSLREQLTALLANATDNDRVFSRTTSFTLALMDAVDLAALDAVLASCVIAGFDADHATCFVEGWVPPGHRAHLAGVALGEAPPLPHLFDHPYPVCAVYRPEEYEALFPGADRKAVGSIAMVPLRAEGLTGTLAIGSWDPQRFAPDMGKVFLLYIGDVLSRTLLRLGVG